MPAMWRWALSAAVAASPATAFAPGELSMRPSRKSARVGVASLTAESQLDAEVVVVGSGLAGLCCGALLAHSGVSVTVLEAHDAAGGAIHTWERRGFHFESGPSLYSGFSQDRSPNPLKAVFDIVGESPEWLTYDRWGTVLPEGRFACKIGPEEFGDILAEFGGPKAATEFADLMKHMAPLSNAAQALPSLALREDVGALITAGRYPKALLANLANGQALTAPFGDVMEKLGTSDKFVKNWLDLLCFLLQGLPAKGTMNAVMAYMLADWYRPGVTLDFPRGGSGAIADSLVRAIEKHPGCSVVTRAAVERIDTLGGKASGVTLKGGRQVKASTAVVANCDPKVTRNLIPRGAVAGLPELDACLDGLVSDWVGGAEDSAEITSQEGTTADEGEAKETGALRSFIHLHAGIDAADLPLVPSADFPAQWAVVRDWNAPGDGGVPGKGAFCGVESPRNVVLVSVPSLLDPSLAPPGKHVLHAYVPATEPWLDWAHMDRKSEEYAAKKAEAEDFLWAAVSEYIPNAKARAEPGTVQLGTPLTHQRFLRRSNGSYGPRAVAGSGKSLPGHKTPLDGLWLCGDYTFPGIGVPAASTSGAIVANSLMGVDKHMKNLDKLRLPNRN